MTASADPSSEGTSADPWCDCSDAPIYVHGPATFLDHPDGCEYPTRVCAERAHRVTIHESCGREIALRFCGCPPSGYTFDAEREWWVHYYCGWPTRPWYEGAGRPAPEHLVGMRPVTYHEFVNVPRRSEKKPDRLTQIQRQLNDAHVGGWVRD